MADDDGRRAEVVARVRGDAVLATDCFDNAASKVDLVAVVRASDAIFVSISRASLGVGSWVFELRCSSVKR